MESTIKVLAVLEAATVTGPAKNLLEFCRSTHDAATDEVTAGAPIIRTSLVTFHRTAASNGSANEFVAAARDTGIEIASIPERFRFDPRVLPSLRRIAARRAPDIVQTHNVKSHFLMRLSGLWRRRPWVAFHHGYITPDWKMRAYNQLDRWSLRAADRVITMNQAFVRQLVEAGVPPQRIRVLHNAVSADWDVALSDEAAAALRAQLGIAPDERVVLAVGRLSQEKAQGDLVTTLAHLRRLHPELKVRLLLVGEGPERRAIESSAEGQGVGAQLTFAGQVSDVRPYYAIADVMALPSLSEGSPNVLLEAMAAGVPVAATDVGGVPEIVTHGESALLVAPRDPQAMAEALSRILTDAPLAQTLVQNAKAAITRCHTPAARRRALLEMYRELAPAPKSTTVPIGPDSRPSRHSPAHPAPAGLKSRAKDAVFSFYLNCGYVQLRDWVLSRRGCSRAIVVYYHRIGDRDVLTKPLDEFRDELHYLKRHYECISLSELCARLRSGQPLRRPVAVVTFDDGYRDNYTEAVPALLAAGVPATFFVATGFIGTQRDFPHDVRAARKRGEEPRDFPKLTWDDLRAMEAVGFEIGSHTVNHTNMGEADETAIQHEVHNSLAALNRELGTRPRAFSFPWGRPGDISAAALRAIQEAEYYAAASAYGGTNSRGSGLFNVRRVDGGNGQLSRLAWQARISGFDPDYLRLRLKMWKV